MSPLRARMIEDMSLAGLAVGTQKIYIQAVPDWPRITAARPISSARKRCGATCSSLRQRGVARGTFKTSQYGLRFLYHHTLEPCLGAVRGKKGSPRHGRSGCLKRCRRIRSGICSASIRNPVHRTCLAVMYACGLRISEATTLEVGAIDRANQVLRIIGKGDKERLVPLPRPVLDELGRLWRTHRNRRWLFPNRRGDAPLNKRVLSDTFACRRRGRASSGG